MRRNMRLLVCTCTAASLLAIAVAVASANRLAFNENGKRFTFASLEFTGGGATVRCPLTLEGSYHSRTLAKVAEALIGYINRAVFGTCTGGNWRANTETLPWHLRYAGFTGTLPTITTLKLKIIHFSITMSSNAIPVPCRYTFAELTTEGTREANGALTGISFTKSNVASETFGCPSTNTFAGNGTVRTPGGGSLIVTLVV